MCGGRYVWAQVMSRYVHYFVTIDELHRMMNAVLLSRTVNKSNTYLSTFRTLFPRPAVVHLRRCSTCGETACERLSGFRSLKIF